MFDEFNSFVKCFWMAIARFQSNQCTTMKLHLLHKRDIDGRIYNLPITSEVIALVVGDFDSNFTVRDIVIENQSGMLQRISKLHPSYIPLQYSLLFSYGEDEFKKDISYHSLSLQICSKQTKFTM